MTLTKIIRAHFVGLVTLLSANMTPAAAQTTEVKNVILVHGAWADGSSWSKVIPILEAKGLHVVAVQLPLSSLADDVAVVKRAVALQDGPVLLVGHSYGGVVITEAGNDEKVSGLVYVAAFAPGDGENIFGISKPYPQAPIGAEFRPDPKGFLWVTDKGFAEDFAQDLSPSERKVLAATQGPTNVSCFQANISSAAWKIKPTWFVIAGNDRVIAPQLEKDEAAQMHATSLTLPSSHVAMLSHPKEVASLIAQATSMGGTN